MVSQPGYQTNTIHILLNISQSKCNQKTKFRHLIDYNKINIFLKTCAENEVWRLVSYLFFFFKQALYEVISVGLQLSFNIF